MERRTKIIATVGPACQSFDILTELCAAGADVFRLNFSHGNHVEKKEWIDKVRKISQKGSKAIAVLADLQGPKIRTGPVDSGAVNLQTGQKIILTTREINGNPETVPVNYPKLPRDVRPGDRVLLDDGLLELVVIKTSENDVECEVVVGGILRSNKGINLPGVNVSTPSITPKDLSDLAFCIENRVDYIALSFVRNPDAILSLKDIIFRHNATIDVIAKIERPEGVSRFDEILAAADGIMVARGDLGVEMSPEKVPLIQKDIIRNCNRAGKPVITATQMLESMISAPRPTRAETSDIANAILDGSDALMLSGETALGKYPIEAVKVMKRVALDVEKHAGPSKDQAGREVEEHCRRIPETIGQAACLVAEKLQATAILAFTQTGKTATLVAKYRPNLPIIAVTPSKAVQRKLTMYRGVFSFLVEIAGKTETQIDSVAKAVLDAGVLQKGDLVVITMGSPVSTPGTTNLLKAHRVGTGDFYEVY